MCGKEILEFEEYLNLTRSLFFSVSINLIKIFKSRILVPNRFINIHLWVEQNFRYLAHFDE